VNVENEEYTGQLEGGPDEGNLITATVRRFRCEVTYRSWLDGRDGQVATFTVKGHYVWNEPTGTFRWELEKWLR
jgi:hypothetical protein